MKRWLSIVTSALLPVSVLAADVMLLTPTRARRPVVASRDDGFAVAWWDYRDVGAPGRLGGGFRFARFTRDGSRVGDEVLLELTDPFNGIYESYSEGHLEATRTGYLLFVQRDAYAAHTISLSASGRPLAPSVPLLERIELYPIQLAASPSTIAMIYSEWNGFFQNWAQRVDATGHADGVRGALAYAVLGGPSGSYTLDSDLTRNGSGFVAAWVQYPVGIRLRELDPQGRPIGDVELVHAQTTRQRNIGIAADGHRQFIVYSEDATSGDSDVFLKIRDSGGTLSAPVPLATEPLAEGVSENFDANHAIRVIGRDDRLAVLYLTHSFGRFPRDHWVFAEFQLDGRPLAAPRDLFDEFGMNTREDVDFKWDPVGGTYVLAWAGGGPQGLGVYVAYVDPAPAPTGRLASAGGGQPALRTAGPGGG